MVICIALALRSYGHGDFVVLWTVTHGLPLSSRSQREVDVSRWLYVLPHQIGRAETMLCPIPIHNDCTTSSFGLKADLHRVVYFPGL
jgi:hypothetical protein